MLVTFFLGCVAHVDRTHKLSKTSVTSKRPTLCDIPEKRKTEAFRPNDKLTPWRKVLLETVLGLQLVKKSPAI